MVKGGSESDPLSLAIWAKERPWWMVMQRRVRQNVANSITTDILHPVDSEQIPTQVEQYRANVQQGLRVILAKLSVIAGELQEGPVKTSKVQEDPRTKVRFITRIRKDGDAWVSEEINIKDNRLISQAQIGSDGTRELTLNYSHLPGEG